jgi:hypothetical protein
MMIVKISLKRYLNRPDDLKFIFWVMGFCICNMDQLEGSVIDGLKNFRKYNTTRETRL